jgi:hypothetical protein
MDATPFLSELPKAIPVLLGGILAISGGIASQYLTHHYSDKRERNKLIREKAELLIGLLYSHRNWLQRESNRLVFGSELEEQVSPLDQAYAIQALYFPEQTKDFAKITEKLKPIINYFYQHGKARLENQEKWLTVFDSSELLPHYEEYLKALNTAIHEITNATKKL